MTVLLDTNIILDIFLHRQPHDKDAVRIIAMSEKGKIHAFVSASAVTDIYFITRKELKAKDAAIELLRKLLKTIHVAAVSGTEIREALDLCWNDFEDSVQYLAGRAILAEYIITRNKDDFADSTIKALTPSEFLNIIAPA